MAETYLLDTDILIEYLRGRQKAIQYLESLKGELVISVISVAELAAGLKDEDEEHQLKSLLVALKPIPVDLLISQTGGEFQRTYGFKYGTGLADALIAATAHHMTATLVTFNKRHFSVLEKIEVPYQLHES